LVTGAAPAIAGSSEIHSLRWVGQDFQHHLLSGPPFGSYYFSSSLFLFVLFLDVCVEWLCYSTKLPFDWQCQLF
jgi:hypothetical protein